MKNRYIVINPEDNSRYTLDHASVARDLAKTLSRVYHKGVEIQRTPEAYKIKQIVISI